MALREYKLYSDEVMRSSTGELIWFGVTKRDRKLNNLNVIYLDFWKACETVSHERLLLKLKKQILWKSLEFDEDFSDQLEDESDR